MNTIKSFSLLFIPLALAACDSQMGPDYEGEALATITGSVHTTASSAPSDLEAFLVWNNSSGSPDTVTGQSVAVDGNFPSTFELNIFTPPPQTALNYFPNEGHIGVAFITALPVGTELDTEDEPSGPFAISEDYMLVYVQEDILPGSSSEEFLGEALPAGFYIMDVIDVDDPACPGDLFDCLRRAPDGMDTEIDLNVTDDIESIDVPNWT